MEYALLIHDHRDAWADSSTSDQEGNFAAHLALLEQMKAAQVYVYGLPLQWGSHAQVLRGGPDPANRLLTDGPFADTKEVLSGFYVIDVADAEQARDWAGRITVLPGDVVEIRQGMALS